jgi:hypothetical protein
MQLGIRNEQAAKIVLDGGLDVVMNRCVKIEHARILGGLHWAGVNTGIVSARRPGSNARRTVIGATPLDQADRGSAPGTNV